MGDCFENEHKLHKKVKKFSLCWPLVAISKLQISIHGQKKDRKGTSKKKKCFKMKLGYRIFVKISRAYISSN